MMVGIAEKLKNWIESSLNPALSAFQNYMNNRTEPEDFSEKDKVVDDFDKTYRLLLHAITEIREVFEANEEPLSESIDFSDNKFKDNCKAYKLTDREIGIIKLIADGKSDSLIADELFISSNTVHVHITKIFKKVKVNKRIMLLKKLGIR